MKSIFAAVLSVGMLCMASEASAFEFLDAILFGGGCGCESACGHDKGCGWDRGCGCDRGCRDRCHRGCGFGHLFSHHGCGCDVGCGKAAPSCGFEKSCDAVQKGCGCERQRCHRGCHNRCHRDRCGCGFGGLFSHWGGCGCDNVCGKEPMCDAGPIQK